MVTVLTCVGAVPAEVLEKVREWSEQLPCQSWPRFDALSLVHCDRVAAACTERMTVVCVEDARAPSGASLGALHTLITREGQSLLTGSSLPCSVRIAEQTVRSLASAGLKVTSCDLLIFQLSLLPL